MQAKALLALLLTPAVCSLLPRDGKSIADTLSAISRQLGVMNQTLDKIQGPNDAQAAVDFENQATQLQSQLQNATGDANQSPSFSDQESSLVAFAVLNVTDVTYVVLRKVAQKRDVFDQIGGSPITDFVRDQVTNLQNTTDTFGAALTNKLVKSVKDVAPLLISALDFHFYQTLQAYPANTTNQQ